MVAILPARVARRRIQHVPDDGTGVHEPRFLAGAQTKQQKAIGIDDIPGQSCDTH
jgi:hypothetical protein